VVAVLKPVNPSIATTSPASRQACGRLVQPLLEGLLGAAFDHVQQACRAGAVADAGQVDDHRDVLVALAGVTPHVLIDTEHGYAVEATRVLHQDPFAVGEDRVVRGVPRHRERFGDPGDGEVLHHDRLQRPPQRLPRQLRPGFGDLAGVLSPHMPTAGAAITAQPDQQPRGSPPERLVRQPTQHGVTRDAFTAAAPAPAVRFDDPAGQERRSGSSRCAVTSNPSSSSRQNVVRSGQANSPTAVTSDTSRSSGWLA
jgi:hypothetical protein